MKVMIQVVLFAIFSLSALFANAGSEFNKSKRKSTMCLFCHQGPATPVNKGADKHFYDIHEHNKK